MRRPAWMDEPPDKWPASAKSFYNLMAIAVERRIREGDVTLPPGLIFSRRDDVS